MTIHKYEDMLSNDKTFSFGLELTIIVPVYNAERYLNKCIESLLRQGVNLYEIILVDDGSIDKSPSICDEYSRLYGFIYTIHKKNEGLGMARNAGIIKARGKYITFVDPDDFVDENYLKKLLECANEKRVEICVSGFYIKDKNSFCTKIACVDPKLWNKMIVDRNVLKQYSMKVVSPNIDGEDFCSSSSCFSLYHRKIFFEYGINFVSERSFISEDVEFNIRVYQKCKSVYFSSIGGYHYCYNESSLSRCYNPERFSLLISTIAQMKEKLSEYGLEDDKRLARYFLPNFEKCINQEVRYKSIVQYRKIKNSIRLMLSDSCVMYYVSILYENKDKFDIKQRLLIRLFLNKHIKSLILILKIYNLIFHR